jgi:hypothetical protein
LTEAGANILGVVVNDVEIAQASAFSVSHHSAYGKYGYGYSYTSHKEGASESEDRETREYGDDE